MAVLDWPTDLKAPISYSPGVMPVDVRPAGLGPVTDVAHKFSKRTLTFEWGDMSNFDFVRLDGLVDYLGQHRYTINVPWRSYQTQLGLGTGSPVVQGDHTAGDTTLNTSTWTGGNPKLRQFDLIGIERPSGVNRLYRVMADTLTGGSPDILIEPGLWVDVPSGTAIRYLGNTGSGDEYLRLTMELADAGAVQGQVYVSPKPQYGRGIVISFVEAIRVAY